MLYSKHKELRKGSYYPDLKARTLSFEVYEQEGGQVRNAVG